MDPYMGELANIPVDKLIEWLFYCVDKKDVRVDAIFWETHCFMEQELPCYNLEMFRKFQEKGIDMKKSSIETLDKLWESVKMLEDSAN